MIFSRPPKATCSLSYTSDSESSPISPDDYNFFPLDDSPSPTKTSSVRRQLVKAYFENINQKIRDLQYKFKELRKFQEISIQKKVIPNVQVVKNPEECSQKMSIHNKKLAVLKQYLPDILSAAKEETMSSTADFFNPRQTKRLEKRLNNFQKKIEAGIFFRQDLNEFKNQYVNSANRNKMMVP